MVGLKLVFVNQPWYTTTIINLSKNLVNHILKLKEQVDDMTLIICRASPLDEGAITFSREGFGRQSMSEKRKAHMDPSHSEVYQKIKTQRDSNRGKIIVYLIKTMFFLARILLFKAMSN